MWPRHHCLNLDLYIEDLVLVVVRHCVEIKDPCFELVRIERFLLDHVLQLCDFISGLVIKSLDITEFSFLLVFHWLYSLLWHKLLVEIFFEIVKLNFDLTHDQLEWYFVLCTYLINDSKSGLLLILSNNFVIILATLQVSCHHFWWFHLSLSIFTNDYLPFLFWSQNHSIINLILYKNRLS